MLHHEVAPDGNLNYLYKFGFMARQLQKLSPPSMNEALIGSVERYAVHDGPGIRTTVFFKGCTLKCPWCHNPELISPFPEAVFHAARCIGCGDCIKACPEDAIDLERADRIERERCTGCGECANTCPARALELVGRSYKVSELIEILLRDRLFYETSDGGITLSGGEPTYQIGFSRTASLFAQNRGHPHHHPDKRIFRMAGF